MRWLEIIKLRTAGQNLKEIVNQYIRPLTKGNEKIGLLTMHIYYHATLTDLSIHLQWETKKSSFEKSLLGICIVTLLEDFGITHHTIWTQHDIEYVPITYGPSKTQNLRP